MKLGSYGLTVRQSAYVKNDSKFIGSPLDELNYTWLWKNSR
jgi:hypothetical protein